jgi:hypothetical protein
MNHYKKWAENKNPFLAAIFLEIAGSSEYIHELINSLRKGKRIEGDISLPKLKTWLKLYKNPKRIGRAALNLMAEQDQASAKEVKILREIDAGARSIQENPEKFKAEYKKLTTEEKQTLFEQSMGMFKELQQHIINDLFGQVSEAKRNKFMSGLKNPDLIFFFRVQAPCFILYKTYPHMLLNEAQNGNDDALEKLIRLDKSIIFEPKIREIIHQAQALKAQARMTMIKKAFINTPKTKISRKKVKFLMGGLISYFSIKMNQKLSTIEIRNLFDAIAMDMTDDIDQDLANNVGESFEKEINRSRKLWDIILADKK